MMHILSFFTLKKLLKVIFIFSFFTLSIGKLSGQQLKVIAYNVEFGKSTTIEEMAELLSEYKPDIICFNEVPAQGWSKEVGELINLPYVFEGEIASANHEEGFKDKTGRYYGKYKSIVSKYPLENTTEIELDGIAWSPASAVVADVVVKNKRIKVISLHIPTGESNPKTSKAHDLAKKIKMRFSASEKIILAGDFNDLYNSEPLSAFYNDGFKDSWRAAKVNLSYKSTYPANKPNPAYVIDHFIFKGLEAKKAGIIESELSDHKPIWAIFKL
ncbi:MAG: endonuclease/exonuclease/phosphatase family protein [Carboxylicivirga sp.]|jgi:endonuclease/exonuclease/phosphatase family metal-dependent hydrolase|nr:endonuclease/exonuclease/phosphatase family protein [Carboxylicivirga sp.]